jgi:hypothetical protein
MKKYLVWLSGKEPHTGKVLTAANSLLARAAAALHHVETKVGETVDHTDFCARPWVEPPALEQGPAKQTFEVWNPTPSSQRTEGIFIIDAISREDACAKLATKLDSIAADFVARPLKVVDKTAPDAVATPEPAAKPLGFTSELNVKAVARSWDGARITAMPEPIGNYNVPLYAGAAPDPITATEAALTSRLTEADADRIETLAKLFAKATAEKAWAGSKHPDDAAAVRRDYAEKSRAFTAALRELVK